MKEKSDVKPSKIIAGIILLIAIVFICYEYYSKYFYLFKSPDKIKNLILSYGKFSVGAFLLLQIIQVVVFFIPGEIVQIAGGYIYGTFWGAVISLAGICVGSILTYFIAATFAKKYFKRYFERKQNFLTKLFKKFTNKYIIFFIYLIPGIPKDIVGYLCGISDIGFKDFIIFSTLGRLPGIFISAYFGKKLYSKDVKTLVVVAAIMSILFIIGLLKGEGIIKTISKSIKKDKKNSK